MRTKRNFSLYKNKLIKYARWLRKNSTLAEVLLWNKLKGKQLLNYTFIRQIPINNYIVDFLCPELKLIIEIDGFSHDFKMDYDKKRQMILEKEGFIVLRFQEKDIRKNMDNTIQQIVDCIETRKILPPPPSPSQGEYKKDASLMSPTAHTPLPPSQGGLGRIP